MNLTDSQARKAFELLDGPDAPRQPASSDWPADDAATDLLEPPALPPALTERMVAAALAARGEQRGAVTDAPAADADIVPIAAARSPAAAARRARPSRLLGSIAGLAAAAALIGIVSVRTAELSEFDATAGGLEEPKTLAPTVALISDRVAQDGLLAIEVAPHKAAGASRSPEVYEPLESRLLVRRAGDGAAPVRWPVMELNDRGKGRFGLRAIVRDVPFLKEGPGRWEIFVVVGRKGRVPDDAELGVALQKGERGDSRAWRAYERRVTVVAAEGTGG